jgi:4,5-DOPA dioxygenase extradiol
LTEAADALLAAAAVFERDIVMIVAPSLFVSHGAPTLAIDDVPARRFLSGLAARIARPQAIVAVSAHDVARGIAVGTAPRFEAVHDFSGFPPALYALRYAPPGEPALAGEIVAMLTAAGLPAGADASPGIDHGIWVPLSLAYPDADIPIVPVSLDATMREASHVAIGRALAPLRERNVLVLASGSLTHNLREWAAGGEREQVAPYVIEFADWVARTLADGNEQALVAWRTVAPHALRAHPTPEHLMPLFVAYGAGGESPRAERLHASVTHGVLAMDAFLFH